MSIELKSIPDGSNYRKNDVEEYIPEFPGAVVTVGGNSVSSRY
jgi:hypothetical protein